MKPWRHAREDQPRGLQDPGHHRWSAAGRRAVRGAAPKDPAVITEIDGRVSFGGIKRGKREIIVTMERGSRGAHVYQVAVGKHLRVHEGDRCGPVTVSPRARSTRTTSCSQGAAAVQEYLLNEIQEVYRLQGVRINDKHIGVIVRQMLQKVNDHRSRRDEYLEGEHVDRMEFRESRTRRRSRKAEKPPRSEPMLLGITKSSLTTESFISAASFQETTRVSDGCRGSGREDHLRGLKENIIIGHLDPRGHGHPPVSRTSSFLVGEPLQEELDDAAAWWKSRSRRERWPVRGFAGRYGSRQDRSAEEVGLDEGLADRRQDLAPQKLVIRRRPLVASGLG